MDKPPHYVAIHVMSSKLFGIKPRTINRNNDNDQKTNTTELEDTEASTNREGAAGSGDEAGSGLCPYCGQPYPAEQIGTDDLPIQVHKDAIT